jgi:hypothetical protein
MRVAICAVAALSLAACATTPVPNARSLTAEQIAAMGPTPVVVVEANDGVTKSWFAKDNSAVGASYGLIGVLTVAVMDGMMNAGPSRRARQAADEIAEKTTIDDLTQSATAPFKTMAATTPSTGGVTFSEISTTQRIATPDPVNDAVEVTTAYTLSEDASTLRVVANVTYQNTHLPYQTQHTFEGAPPKSELTGPAYRNSFTYMSRQIAPPILTPELKERLIASIEASARDEAGNLPVEGTDGFKAMTRELEQAQDGELSKEEIAIFLTREWAKDDGALLRQELANAHDFVSRFALADINAMKPASMTGTDEVVEVAADGRTVRRLGAGVIAGSYVSSPAEVSAFVTFGNAVGVAKTHIERTKTIRENSGAANAAR